MNMPFGKHRGCPLPALPGDYLAWLRTLDLREPLSSAVDAEIARRRDPHRDHHHRHALIRVPPCPAPAIAEEVIGIGFRHLARDRHPDAGGSHDRMIALTAATDWLRAVVRAWGAGA